MSANWPWFENALQKGKGNKRSNILVSKTSMSSRAANDTGGLVLRDTRPEDLTEVQALHQQAFRADGEAQLVVGLHSACESLISIVAELNTAIVGHILFSPVSIEPGVELTLYGLAPMAIVPQMQSRGIGGRLVTEGMAKCHEHGVDGVVVLGHKDYYPRFGFQPASTFGLRCTYDVPSEVFMAKELRSGSLRGVSGTIHYHPLFNQL